MEVRSQFGVTSSRTPTFRLGTILSLFVAVAVMVPVGFFNRYIFAESNAPFLLVILACAALVGRRGRLPRGWHLPSISLPFLAFILYAWMRLDDPLSLSFSPSAPGGIRPGSAHVVDLLVYFLLFIAAAWKAYGQPRLGPFTWFLVCGYLVAYILRSSLDLTGLQQGSNLSAGLVLVTLIPFVFLGPFEENRRSMRVPVSIWVLCTLWSALIGARTAVVALVVFGAVMFLWPRIVRGRITFHLVFWGLIVSVVGLYVLYFTFVTTEGGALLEDSGIGIFQKRLGTRIDIWTQLRYLTLQRPWIGWGTDHLSAIEAPLQFLDFSFNRNNLESHSTYFETWFRMGFWGVAMFVLLMSQIWSWLWWGRHVWSVRVAGAFLLSLLFFIGAGTSLILSDTQLRNGFCWVVLGLGAGASLYAKRAPIKQ